MRKKNNWTSFKDLQGFVCLVLLVDWDPIRIFGFSATVDEYDSYAEKISELLRSSVSVEALAAYLYHLERKTIEITTSERRRAEVARKLIRVHEAFEEHERRKAECLAEIEVEKQATANSEMPL